MCKQEVQFDNGDMQVLTINSIDKIIKNYKDYSKEDIKFRLSELRNLLWEYR